MAIIATVAARAALREELERALADFEGRGGEVQSVPILPGREVYLRYRGAEFDEARKAASRARAARQSASAQIPDYLRNLRAYTPCKRNEA